MFSFFKNKETIVESRTESEVEKTLSFHIIYTEGDMQKFTTDLLIRIAREKELLQGLFLLYDGKSVLSYLSGYACNNENIEELSFEAGEGLAGQVALDRKLINLKNVPEGYITVKTGLGQASPSSLIVFPVINDNQLIGVMELASFREFTSEDEAFFNELSLKTGNRMSNLSIRGNRKNG
jgi:putative methionine-R-sulfoxide reductase with GAF domain